MKKEYIAFSMKLAGFLMQRGFVLKRLEPSTRPNSNRKVFIFNESEDLIMTVEYYKTLNK